jgi:nucleoside-diphosphate-sugar epimerase
MTENVAQTLSLFRLTHATGCRTWIGIGSQAEYGPQARSLSEDMPTLPVTCYGAAKLCVGNMLATLCEVAGVRFVWLRLLATYGPKDDVRHLIPSVTLQLLARQRPALTRGEQSWDYLYVEDAADAVLVAAECERAQGVYNLGSGEAVAVRSIVEKLRDLIDPSLPLGLGELPYREDQLMLLQADISKLHAATGWMPRTSLDDGLERTVAWHRLSGGRF